MLGEVEWLETVRQPLQGVVYARSRYYHHRLVRTTLSGWFSRLTMTSVRHQLKQGYEPGPLLPPFRYRPSTFRERVNPKEIPICLHLNFWEDAFNFDLCHSSGYNCKR